MTVGNQSVLGSKFIALLGAKRSARLTFALTAFALLLLLVFRAVAMSGYHRPTAGELKAFEGGPMPESARQILQQRFRDEAVNGGKPPTRRPESDSSDPDHP